MPPTPEALHAALDAVERGLRDGLRPAHALMRRYLPEPSTQAILFSPIKGNALEAFGQLQTRYAYYGCSYYACTYYACTYYGQLRARCAHALRVPYISDTICMART